MALGSSTYLLGVSVSTLRRWEKNGELTEKCKLLGIIADTLTIRPSI